VAAGKAEEIVRLLQRTPNVTCYGVHGRNHVVILAEGHDEQQLENLRDYILNSYEDVQSVSSTVAG